VKKPTSLVIFFRKDDEGADYFLFLSARREIVFATFFCFLFFCTFLEQIINSTNSQKRNVQASALNVSEHFRIDEIVNQKYTKTGKYILNDHKMYQMATKCTK
jgi:hypothetical protein